MALPFRAIIFDLDGTLVDSLGDIAEAMNTMLRRHGFPLHDYDAFRKMVGEGVEHTVTSAVPKDCGVPLQKLVDEYRVEYRALQHAHSEPYPGIELLLQTLNDRNVPMSVLSNKRDEFTKDLVKQKLSGATFVEVRGEFPDRPRKPDPTAALQMIKAFGVPAAEVAFVGDTAVDMKTAVAAGARPIGVLWGFRDREELVNAGARHLIAKPSDLLKIA